MVSYAEQAAAKNASKRVKQERKSIAVRKIAIKTKPELLKECQVAFNEYIRARDKDRPCISCGRQHQGQYHAGHFLSVGARAGLRFDERNCHKQCQPCNTHLHGNLINYRIRLIRKIGLAEVERLECDVSEKHYTREELMQMTKDYRKKARELK